MSQVTEPGAPFRDNLRNGLDWVSSSGRGDHSSPLNSFRLALPTHVPQTTARVGSLVVFRDGPEQLEAAKSEKFHRTVHTRVAGADGLIEFHCIICGRFVAASIYLVVVKTAEAIHKCEGL
jgi:hypothetical protein